MRRALLSLGSGLMLSALLALPALAQEDEARPERTDRPTDQREHDAERDTRRDARSDHPIEVLDLGCEALHAGDGPVDGEDHLRAHGVACRWSSTSIETATGYQLWRVLGEGAREIVWRGGLDVTSHAERVPADAHVATYAVVAVNEAGETVARSRAVHVRLVHDHGHKPTVAEVQPVEETAADTAPADEPAANTHRADDPPASHRATGRIHHVPHVR